MRARSLGETRRRRIGPLRLLLAVQRLQRDAEVETEAPVELPRGFRWIEGKEGSEAECDDPNAPRLDYVRWVLSDEGLTWGLYLSEGGAAWKKITALAPADLGKAPSIIADRSNANAKARLEAAERTGAWPGTPPRLPRGRFP